MKVLLGEPFGYPGEHGLGIGQGRAVEDISNGLSYLPALSPIVGMGLSILGQVELAPLPGDRGKPRPAGRSKSHVIVTNHQFDSLESSPLQGLQELPPVDFRFTELVNHQGISPTLSPG